MAAADRPVRTTVSLQIQAVVDVTDAGYLGTGATVAEHIAWAEKDAKNWQWSVKKGSLDPQPVLVKTTVVAVSIVPQTEGN